MTMVKIEHRFRLKPQTQKRLAHLDLHSTCQVYVESDSSTLIKTLICRSNRCCRSCRNAVSLYLTLKWTPIVKNILINIWIRNKNVLFVLNQIHSCWFSINSDCPVSFQYTTRIYNANRKIHENARSISLENFIHSYLKISLYFHEFCIYFIYPNFPWLWPR